MKGVLKKDSSYDETLKPILKNPDDASVLSVEMAAANGAKSVLRTSSTSSSSSVDDVVNKKNAFSDVVIDPEPNFVGESNVIHAATSGSRKASLKNTANNREPVIPPSSIKISSGDPNLARKLEQVSIEAEAIKKQREAEAIKAEAVKKEQNSR